MSQNNQPNLETGNTQPYSVSQEILAGQVAEVNRLLHELEGLVSEEQHALLTDFLAERAVLNAMKMRLNLDNMQA